MVGVLPVGFFGQGTEDFVACGSIDIRAGGGFGFSIYDYLQRNQHREGVGFKRNVPRAFLQLKPRIQVDPLGKRTRGRIKSACTGFSATF